MTKITDERAIRRYHSVSMVDMEADMGYRIVDAVSEAVGWGDDSLWGLWLEDEATQAAVYRQRESTVDRRDALRMAHFRLFASSGVRADQHTWWAWS